MTESMTEAIASRHSVRSYREKQLPHQLIKSLQDEIDACNTAGHLHIQLVTNEPQAFSGMLAHYGNFKGVTNYIALIGADAQDLQERCGYYGQRLVLQAQMLGLNTCWVAMTFSKGNAKKHLQLSGNDKIACVLALGYGTVQGEPHRSKPLSALFHSETEAPDWVLNGMNAVLMAPTAMNQQKFLFDYSNQTVSCKSLGGPYSSIDLGIVEYQFEAGSGHQIVSF